MRRDYLHGEQVPLPSPGDHVSIPHDDMGIQGIEEAQKSMGSPTLSVGASRAQPSGCTGCLRPQQLIIRWYGHCRVPPFCLRFAKLGSSNYIGFSNAVIYRLNTIQTFTKNRLKLCGAAVSELPIPRELLELG